MSELIPSKLLSTPLQIPTPFHAKHIERIAERRSEFRHVLQEVLLTSELSPTITELAVPTSDAEHRFRMGANIALRTLLDISEGVPAITRLGAAEAFESTDPTASLVLHIQPATVVRDNSGRYILVQPL